jgi:homoserine dehydrogenase
MAKHGPELVELARQHGQRLEYGASVGGGVPVLAALRYGLAGDRLVRVCGILNGTCNFILSNMEANGTALGAALAEAQKLGYAESDPCDDVNGVDAACKLAIVARLGLQTYLNAFEIPRQSINQIQPADFAFARQLGYTIRQISFAELKANAVQTSVGPALVPLNSPLASTAANQNAIIVTGERSGETLLVGKGAGGDPTAVAVVSDLLALTEPGHSQTGAPVAKNHAAEELKRPHYLRVCRQPGTDLLSAVTRILDAHGVRVQKALDNTDKQTWQAAALLLETCSGAVVHKTVEEIAKLDGVSQAPLCLPIFD